MSYRHAWSLVPSVGMILGYTRHRQCEVAAALLNMHKDSSSESIICDGCDKMFHTV